VSSIHEILFENPPIPRRIEDDPMFTGWSRDLPRLWFLDERQATRLDAESLYGAQEYATLYSRLVYTVLPPIVQTSAVGVRGYTRGDITVLPVPIQTPARVVHYTRTHTTFLPLTQTSQIWSPSGSPLNPIPAPPEGAERRS
jgi:hypothetical protein